MSDWAIIGAGPAGIAAVGKLLDQKIPAEKITWIDPAFKVGDFGTLWRNVPSNTKVSLFLKFLHACEAFHYDDRDRDFEINHLDSDNTCYLHYMAEPLQWVSDHLKNKVNAITDTAHQLSLKNRCWEITLQNKTIDAKNVILATGADAKNLAYTTPTIIPLHDAMDLQRLKNHCQPDDTIAVFGASHSAILALRNLTECAVKKIINFYRGPLRYAVYLEDWILFDDSGLKGSTAEWARAHIDGVLPKNMQRIYASNEKIEHHLPECNKVIYAVGFDKRHLPVIEGLGHLTYIEECGIIAPGLFGLGIAYPEAKYNPFNILEYRVGLWKFMDYLHRVLPIWMKYGV